MRTAASSTSNPPLQPFLRELLWSLLRSVAFTGGLAVLASGNGFGGASTDVIVLRLSLVFVTTLAVQALIVLGGYLWLKLRL